MKYRIFMHVVVDARDGSQATEHAKKLAELLRNPMVRLAIEAEGIRLVGSSPVVYQPAPD